VARGVRAETGLSGARPLSSGAGIATRAFAVLLSLS